MIRKKRDKKKYWYSALLAATITTMWFPRKVGEFFEIDIADKKKRERVKLIWTGIYKWGKDNERWAIFRWSVADLSVEKEGHE